jgi:SOS-response transcriptional repressor LexA
VKYIEGAHHTTGQNYGMGEAELVEKLVRETISPTLNRAFKTAREHRLLHGGMKALYAIPPTASLPEGYQKKVRGIPLKVLGRAAALSNGKAADGMVAMDHFESDAHVAVVLGAHFAYRLTAKTLEPVARPGDVLLVREHGESSPKSLVVALTDERILARRLEIAENVTDVAVLTAQAINPREIAPPVIAHKSTLKLHKITGIFFDRASWATSAKAEGEVCDCGGESDIARLTTDAMGLVEVVGQSAEPQALDGQYLIVRNSVASEEALRALDGSPVIASDNDNNFYFKRLRLSAGDKVVLESLDSGGDYPPILLSRAGQAGDVLKDVWPVVGVLFERPN